MRDRWSPPEVPFLGAPVAAGATTVLVLLAVWVGVARGPYAQSQIGLVAGLAVAALGYNVALGIAGQFLFCQAAFMAMGCYLYALTAPAIGTLPAVALALSGTGLTAAVVGLAVLRTREIYLAVVTLAFASALGVVIQHYGPTNGDDGMRVDVLGSRAWLAGLAALWLAMLFYDRFRTSQLGQMCMLVASDEETALTTGTWVNAVRVLAVTLAGVLGALGGVVWGGALGFVTPATFSTRLTLLLLTIIVIAGSRVAWATVLVCGLYVGALQYLTTTSRLLDLVYGGLLIAAIYLRAELGERRAARFALVAQRLARAERAEQPGMPVSR